MLESLKVAFGGAVGSMVYQFIRFGTSDFDWLAPIVVGVMTFIVYALISKVSPIDPGTHNHH